MTRFTLEIIALGLSSFSLFMTIVFFVSGETALTLKMLVGGYAAMFAAYVFHD